MKASVPAFSLVAALATPGLAGPKGTWDIQYSDPFVLDREVAVLNLDGDATDQLKAAKARGQTVLCYFSVGTAEDWRADFPAFPAAVKGPEWPEWPGEYFLDVRAQDVLLPIMQARFQACADAGADAVDPDNQDQQWAEAFAVTEADVVAYMRALADIAHGMGLQIGQKNNPDTVVELVGTLDFIVTEDCFNDGWCEAVLPYAKAGKPVYAIEYTDTAVDFAAACAYGTAHGLSFILKDRALSGAVYQSCD